MIDVVAGIITREDGAVLLARRGPGKSNAGMWEFPGGKLEPGETPEAGLARELREELGVEVAVGAYVATGVAGGVSLRGYRARIVAGEIALSDHDAVAWVRPADLATYPMHGSDLPLAAAVAGS
jgi:8-oxo-dGTP diphosphatase